ncbi:MAG: replicative DNA helicase [bacterium]|nr:replicative DNA helicase [bacterium]MDE0502293.1 replicative DNA helicase [bacterium]
MVHDPYPEDDYLDQPPPERRRGRVGRVPPHSREAEESVLGAILLSRDATNRVMEVLDTDDFYEPVHGLVFEAARRLFNESQAIDVLTLAEELRRTDSLERIGGHERLADLSQSVPNIAHADRYAAIVAEHSQRRRLIDVSQRVTDLAMNLDRTTETVIDQAERMMLEVNDETAEEGLLPAKDLIGSVFEDIEKQGDQLTGLATGLKDLDSQLMGLKPGALVVVAGRPAMGKSAFAQTVAINVAQTGGVIALFSLEMSKEEILTRLLSMVGEVNSAQIRAGVANRQHLWDKLIEAAGRIHDWKLYLDDSPEPTVTEIRAKCRRLRREEGLDLVIVDYLQLMPSADASSSRNPEYRQQEIAGVSRSLKALARELNIPVIGISQLNRAVELRNDKRPLLSDLRESGAIEQDADIVLFLYRPEYYAKDKDKEALKNQAQVIIAKHRAGPTGMVQTTFAKEYTLFRNFTGAAPPDPYQETY